MINKILNNPIAYGYAVVAVAGIFCIAYGYHIHSNTTLICGGIILVGSLIAFVIYVFKKFSEERRRANMESERTRSVRADYIPPAARRTLARAVRREEYCSDGSDWSITSLSGQPVAPPETSAVDPSTVKSVTHGDYDKRRVVGLGNEDL